MMPAEETVTWNVEVTGRDGSAKDKFVHSTFKGTLIAREDLRKMRPEYMPRLSAWGEAERAILELCDGSRSVRQIAQEVHLRFPENFRSPDKVEAHVNRVILGKAR